MNKLKHIKLSATQILVISLIIVTFIGAIILKLPVCNKQGKSISFVDSLFVSTSVTCVTGLTPVAVSEQFSFFGQLIILILIQLRWYSD